MNDNTYLVKTITELLEKGTPLVLASIVIQEGSAPRHTGTKMVIDANGKIYGTIGGSLLEAAAIKEAGTTILDRQTRFMEFALSGKDANAKGMICGGNTRILLDYIAATNENKSFFHLFNEGVEKGATLYFLTHLQDQNQRTNTLGHSLLYPDGHVIGSNLLTPEDIGTLKSELHNLSSLTIMELGKNQVVIDPIRKVKTLYCCGAGHVALPTAHIAALAGFRVIAMDDRPEFANAERFPEADRVLVIQDYKKALPGLEIDADSFIVIFTRGHQFDREVLEQALKTLAGYIGMISSRRKKAAIYEALLAEGVTQAELDRVHSPIGVEIGAETPEEIAVSIVAELIAVRAKQQQ